VWGHLCPGHECFLVFAMLCSALFVTQTLYSLCFSLIESIFVVQKLILI
jgi:hypothetical protein